MSTCGQIMKPNCGLQIISHFAVLLVIYIKAISTGMFPSQYTIDKKKKKKKFTVHDFCVVNNGQKASEVISMIFTAYFIQPDGFQQINTEKIRYQNVRPVTAHITVSYTMHVLNMILKFQNNISELYNIDSYTFEVPRTLNFY